MGQSKKTSRQQKGTPSKQVPWLPVAVVGVLLVIGAAAILLGSGGNDKPPGLLKAIRILRPKLPERRVWPFTDYIDYGEVKPHNHHRLLMYKTSAISRWSFSVSRC
jgi:hypothetical protein